MMSPNVVDHVVWNAQSRPSEQLHVVSGSRFDHNERWPGPVERLDAKNVVDGGLLDRGAAGPRTPVVDVTPVLRGATAANVSAGEQSSSMANDAG